MCAVTKIHSVNSNRITVLWFTIYLWNWFCLHPRDAVTKFVNNVFDRRIIEIVLRELPGGKVGTYIFAVSNSIWTHKAVCLHMRKRILLDGTAGDKFGKKEGKQILLLFQSDYNLSASVQHINFFIMHSLSFPFHSILFWRMSSSLSYCTHLHQTCSLLLSLFISVFGQATASVGSRFLSLMSRCYRLCNCDRRPRNVVLLKNHFV